MLVDGGIASADDPRNPAMGGEHDARADSNARIAYSAKEAGRMSQYNEPWTGSEKRDPSRLDNYNSITDSLGSEVKGTLSLDEFVALCVEIAVHTGKCIRNNE